MSLQKRPLSVLRCLNVSSLLGVTLLLLAVMIGCTASSNVKHTTLNVRDFGAKGDGSTDDYDALQAAATALCRSPDTTLIFPQGIYLIDRYRITAGPNRNNVLNIRYEGCEGTTIKGDKATVEVKGNFHRNADSGEGKARISYSTSVIPFELINSSHFRITGFEIVGNVEKMSRDADVVEGSASGILTTNCNDYSIENVFVHGFASDGITIGGNSEVADERVRLVNVTSNHNGRQGLALIQVRDGQITNSVFSYNGRAGAYGHHDPAAGVAVEPVRYPPKENVSTGEIVFDKCRFEENVGPQFISGLPEAVDSLTIQNSYVKDTLQDTDVTAFMSVPKVGLITGNTFVIGAGRSVALGVYRPAQYQNISRITYSKNTFKLSDNHGILAPIQAAPIELVDNDIKIDSRTADRTILRLDYLKLIENNRFFEANSGYSGVHYTVLFENGCPTVRNNKYDTDRSSPGYFDVYYGPGVTMSGDVFPHPANFQPHSVKAAEKLQ